MKDALVYIESQVDLKEIDKERFYDLSTIVDWDTQATETLRKAQCKRCWPEYSITCNMFSKNNLHHLPFCKGKSFYLRLDKFLCRLTTDTHIEQVLKRINTFTFRSLCATT